MATVSFVEKECAICGVTNSYSEISTVKISTPTGIDGHPGEIRTLASSLNFCPSCGYSASDISYSSEKIKAIVFSDTYKKFVKNGTVPESVKKFMAASFIERAQKFYSSSARYMLEACWVAEGLQYGEALLSSLRNYTLELLLEAQECGSKFEMSIWHEAQIIVDLYRREQEFEDAIEICSAALQRKDEIAHNVIELLEYELWLCEKKDSSFKTFADLHIFLKKR